MANEIYDLSGLFARNQSWHRPYYISGSLLDVFWTLAAPGLHIAWLMRPAREAARRIV